MTALAPARPMRRLSRRGAALSVALPAVLLLVLAGRPLYTDDLWFHLKAGETYLREGLWPDADPMLHTAHEEAPVQHEWLFGVAVYAIERAAGFHGLRLVHVLAVAGILWLAWSLFRREAGSLPAAAAAFAVFAALAWWRLFQLRPDLVSIPAALLLYRLLLEPRAPASWRRLGLALALLCVWANAHSLFGLGIALLVAALLGEGFEEVLSRLALARPPAAGAGAPAAARAPEVDGAARARRAARLALALGLGLLVTAANPRGFAHHLTFFTSTRETPIWAIRGEWTHWNPFAYGHYGGAVSPLAFALADGLLLAFAAAAALAFARFLRRRDTVSILRVAPVLFGLGAAAFAAAFVSIRFLWMAVFPLLYLLRRQRHALAARPAAAARAEAVAAAFALAVALAFPAVGGYAQVARSIPRRPATYLAQPYSTGKYHVEGVGFLRATGIEGRLFNSYVMGGFLGYWTAPRLRTFVDGRTEHYRPAVLHDYFAVNHAMGARGRESFLDVLARRRVDVFFGVGLPLARAPGERRIYTTAHLEGAPGWRLVQRALDHAIYVRADARANLARAAAYYADAGVPFDEARGLDPAAVIAARPDWAAAHGMLPPGYARRAAERAHPDPARRLRALETLAATHVLLGLYETQLALDREALALRADALASRRRLVYSLLRLGRPRAAQVEARALQRLDPGPRSAAFVEAVRSYLDARAGRGGAGPRIEPDAYAFALPLLTEAEARRLLSRP